MKKDSSLFIFILLSVFLTSLISCTPESCLEDTESFLEASFYSDSTGKALAPDSLTVFGAGRDTSKIYSASTGVRVASFPLNAETGSSVFIIKINGTTDTLTFLYSSYPHLISRECGYTYYHDLIESPLFTTNIIDSISTKNNVITTKIEENIQIFY